MVFREAKLGDIPQMHTIRMSVTENKLSNPDSIAEGNYEVYLMTKGKSWICEMNEEIVGFSIVDLEEKNVWALFVKSGFEGKGIGKKLQERLLDCYFSQRQ